VFGCGPVGQFVIASVLLMGAGRVIAVDTVDTRLEMARAQGAEVVDYEKDDPIEAIKALTGGIGVDRVVDAVGVDASRPHHGPAERKVKARSKEFARELGEIAPKQHPEGDNWHPGDAPSLVLTWALEALAKAGTLSIIGVYPPAAHSFPIGVAMNKNITMKGGICNHRRYLSKLIELVRTGAVRPSRILTQREPLANAIEAYRAFDQRKPGWTKVELKPAA
jgi:threonine dehydrogenase-like Zn-dependent dehydrogenase